MDYGIVRTLKWADADHTKLECMITFPAFNAELPFTATATDSEAHGREIFERAVKGDFGTIEDHDEPVVETELVRNLDAEWEAVRKKRNQLLKDSDFSQLLDVQESFTDDEKAAWRYYREMLRIIPNHVQDPADALAGMPMPPKKELSVDVVEEEVTPPTEP